MHLFNPLGCLDPHLTERLRPLNSVEEVRAGLVVVWLRTALRAWENPALDVGIGVANELQRPLVVVQALSERYRHASDRHHWFILQGARDLSSALAGRGIRYVLHVDRPGHRTRWWTELLERAAVLVTDDLPIAPLRGWTRTVAEAAPCPVWATDCANVVPAGLVPGKINRAFRFRKKTADLLEERIRRPWPEQTPSDAARDAEAVALPFEPVDIERADLEALIATCRIDHSVGPVLDTPGGSTAGYARWKRFVQEGLRGYARTRNDAARQGVSRMSAYLHYGMVAPTRIAREAARVGGAGAEKYLDELIVWRELANHWCRNHEDHESLERLPTWAQQTLREHAEDPRPAHLDLETLCRAKSGDALWDAAQRSLLRHGELHNNVRMTWGKAVLNWTPDPESALRALFHLNDRYALDGRDPSSVAGLLWCLGGMDRPFSPERPILGGIRPRPLEQHSSRLDLDTYERHVGRTPPPWRIAVVGAGVAGAICARTLSDHGATVSVFDKGRGAGGRLSTRRTGLTTLDHGAPAFTVRDPRIGRLARSWRARGVIARWDAPWGTLGPDGFTAEPTPRFVGSPTMNALLKHLLADVDVAFGTRVTALGREGDAWRLDTEAGPSLGPFDAVVLAVPAPQAAPLLDASDALRDAVDAVEVAPTWTVLVQTAHPLDLTFGAAAPTAGPIDLLVRNQTKPGRAAAPGWLLHATPAWSREHLEDDKDRVAEALVAAAQALVPELDPIDSSAHRWRYARVTRPLGTPSLYEPVQRLGLCGDALLGDGVENALLSGMSMAGRLLTAMVAAGSQGTHTQLELPT